MERFDAAIIGGGMAGLSAAYHLVNAGLSVCVVEREALLCTHSSGRNAAIFRHLEPSADMVRLALESRRTIDALVSADAAPDAPSDGDGQWLRAVGALYVGESHGALSPLLHAAGEAALEVQVLEGEALFERAPQLTGSAIKAGAFSPEDGVMDTARVTDALARAVRAGGGRILTGRCVAAIEREGDGPATGVRLDDGETVAANHVVVAAGAWAAELAAEVGCALPLVPLRRHLALLKSDAALVERDLPVVWKVDGSEVYARAEGGELLASPCDEAPWPPSLPVSDPAALDLLADKLPRFFPRAEDAQVHTYWACLRTFAPDRNLVVGADPRCEGLHWMAGLGGHGMTLGVAAGAVLARSVLGTPHNGDDAFSPRRLLA